MIFSPPAGIEGDGRAESAAEWAKARGVPEDGPYFLRCYRCDMARVMDGEVGLVTAEARAGDGDIQPGVMPAGRYAMRVYKGNGLRGNQALMAWASEQGVVFDALVPGQPESYVCRYEAYLTDYRVESRKLLWDVELAIKVAPQAA